MKEFLSSLLFFSFYTAPLSLYLVYQDQAVPALDVSASYDAETQKGAIFLVNRGLTEAVTTEIVWQDGNEVCFDKAWELTGNDPKEVNSWDAPNQLAARAIGVPQIDNGRSTISLPPLSFTVLTTRTV